MRKSGFAPSVWGPVVWSLWMAVSSLPPRYRRLKAEMSLLLTRLLPCEPCRCYITVFVMSSATFANGEYTLEHMHRLRCRVRAKIESGAGKKLRPASEYSPSLQDCQRRAAQAGIACTVDPRAVLCMMAAQAAEEDDEFVDRGIHRIACLARFCNLLCTLPKQSISLPVSHIYRAMTALLGHIKTFDPRGSDRRAFCADAFRAFANSCAESPGAFSVERLDAARGPILPFVKQIEASLDVHEPAAAVDEDGGAAQ
jgi:hypothetical protein